MSIESSFWVGPPDNLDTYQLINTLGTGGEGQVWRAVVPLSDAGKRQVAVKILPANLWAKEQDWNRFGHLLKSLTHPGLVRVSEVFSGPAMHRYQQQPATAAYRYIVMDFVEGVTLTEWLAENPDATVAQRIAMLRTVAAALDEMHSGQTTEVPVAHGDVKPANIILKPDGGTVLVDLGLARLSDGAGVSGHTSPYAAPELHQPSSQVTAATDSFAFIATLTHLLIAQAPPLDATGVLDPNAVYQLLSTAPLTQRRPALVRQIMNALTSRPDLRPVQLSNWLAATGDTVSQLTSDVAAPHAGPVQAVESTTPADPPPPSKRAARPTPASGGRRKRRLLSILLAAIVLGAGGYATGAITRPAWAASAAEGSSGTPISAVVPGPTVTERGSTTTITAGSTITVTAAATTDTQAGTVNQPSTAVTSRTAGADQRPTSLLDLDWKTFTDRTTIPDMGLLDIQGVSYRNSIETKTCNCPLIVVLPAGYSKFSGTFGFADDYTDGTMTVHATTV